MFGEREERDRADAKRKGGKRRQKNKKRALKDRE